MTSTDVRLLKGTDQLCRIALDMGGGVRSCDITDPYIIVLLNDGTVAQLHLQGEGLQLSWPDLEKGSRVTLISAYTDTSGLFATESQGVGSEGTASTYVLTQRKLSIDDEDELLYGDVDALTAKIGRKSSLRAKTPDTVEGGSVSTSNWCALYRDNGSLEIYQIPGFKKVFGVRNFSSCPKTLKDSGPLSSE